MFLQVTFPKKHYFHLKIMIPAIATAIPIAFLHSQGCFSTPNHPKSSMIYATKSWATTISITALAGPLANVVICCVFLFIYGLVYIPLTLVATDVAKAVLDMVYLTAYLSIALAIFNIIPISPLDGSKILFSFLSDEGYMKLMRYERYGMIVLLVLVVTNVLSNPLYTATQFVFDKLFVFADWGFALVKALYV